jgi:predicted acyl esterase
MTGTHYTPVLYEESAAGAVSIITRGFLNLRNRNGLHVSEPVSAGEAWTATVEFWDTDYVVPAGHRLGLAIMSSNAVWALPDVTLATTTLDLSVTALDLPVSEGAEALAEARNAQMQSASRYGGALGLALLSFLCGVLWRWASFRSFVHQ